MSEGFWRNDENPQGPDGARSRTGILPRRGGGNQDVRIQQDKTQKKYRVSGTVCHKSLVGQQETFASFQGCPCTGAPRSRSAVRSLLMFRRPAPSLIIRPMTRLLQLFPAKSLIDNACPVNRRRQDLQRNLGTGTKVMPLPLQAVSGEMRGFRSSNSPAWVAGEG